MAEKETDRIEDVADDLWQCDQIDASHGIGHALARQQFDHLVADGAIPGAGIVGVADGREASAVMTEAAYVAIQRGKLVEVDAEPNRWIGESVSTGLKPAMPRLAAEDPGVQSVTPHF